MRWTLLVALCIALAGCGGGDEPGTGFELILELEAIEGSGVEGTASVAGITGDRTRVVVEVTGLRPGTRAAAHIHGGTCAAPSRVAYALTPVANGRSRTVIDVPVLDIQEEVVAIDVHRAANGGATVACGEVAGF